MIKPQVHKALTPQISENIFGPPQTKWLTASPFLFYFGGGGGAPQPHLSRKVMEAIPNGELFDLITAEGQAMTDGTMRRLVHGIINGMAELCGL